jgi:LemA protein
MIITHRSCISPIVFKVFENIYKVCSIFFGMKYKGVFAIAIAIAIIFIIALWFLLAYNSLVKKDEAVKNQWAQVQTQYQRRIDLIPNLVNTVKGYTQFEAKTLSDITALRTQWMNAQNEEEKITTANELESALSKIIVTYENYPDLKSVAVVASLMDELAGTENRISVERKRYNDVVNTYNVAIKTFPNNIIASSFGFKEKQYFKAQSDDVPDVSI